MFGLSPIPIVLIVGTIVGLIVVMQLRKTAGSTSRNSAFNMLLIFTKVGALVFEKVPNFRGGMVSKRFGGFAELEGRSVILRTGRVNKKPGNEEHAKSLRKRQYIYVVREGDGTPLDLAAGAEKSWVGRSLGSDWVTSVRNMNFSYALDESIHKGSMSSFLAGRLAWGVLASIIAGVVGWVFAAFAAMTTGGA